VPRELRGKSSPAPFIVVGQAVELVLTWDPAAAVMLVDLGVPQGVLAEEPGYRIELMAGTVAALKAWLPDVDLPAEGRPPGRRAQ
jgi:hypothetical protein